ncbi:MAG TPA: ATP-binding protein [Candidatus Dormibacteraeota bacterium]|nr:ATP-binding protein [Candidatus Dormibacteraeota bacterium]
MGEPKLYFFIGYPGAGKTTVSKFIAKATGATHLWADLERHKLFESPTHTEEESLQLYNRLNKQAEDLLATGRSVVYDTNFNFYSDRQKMRDIAARRGAEAVLIWINVPKEAAKKRAVNVRDSRNGYMISMTEEEFETIAAKLEPPKEDEKFIKINGLKLDRQEVLRLLSL